MTFVTPAALAALAALPLIWWLLRLTPPPHRREVFPAIRLLRGLDRAEETPARTPWWLLLLRLAAAACVIVALARPVLNSTGSMTGSGPVLLVIDNGWTAGPDWPKRMKMAEIMLDRAARAGRAVALLATAPNETGAPPKATPPLPVAAVRPLLGALRPQPWPSNRAAALPETWSFDGADVVYVADGVEDGSGFDTFARRLPALGRVTEIAPATPAHLLPPPETTTAGMTVRVIRSSAAAAETVAVLAQTGDGRTLARTEIALPAGAQDGRAEVTAPVEIRNRIARMVLDGPASAGSVAFLDEHWRRRPVGLLTTGLTGADIPLTGPLYYVKRALAPFADPREGDFATLTRDPLSVLILTSGAQPAAADAAALTAWVRDGGLLIRFASPSMTDTAAADPLLPVALLAGDRELGGAMSWNEPAGLAAFPPSSPFTGLIAAPEVRVTRQVLAAPGPGVAAHTWASLVDGTPLVTFRALGSGTVVLFHVTSNAEWSDLPLSGLFVDMLNRLVALSAGVATAADNAVLAPAETLDGFGNLGRPPEAARGLEASAFGTTVVSPRHPPGMYGPDNGRRVLNLGAATRTLTATPRIAGAAALSLDETTNREQELGPAVLAVAIVLLVVDLLLSLTLRGLLRPHVLTLAWLVLAVPAWSAEPAAEAAALATRLGHVVSGDNRADAIAQEGLEGLSAYVNRRTATALARPDAVEPGRTDLSVYPLLYWPVTDMTPALTPDQAAALNTFLARGGILVIDTGISSGGTSGGPKGQDSLKRATRGLTIPPLTPLTAEDVLARSFYLLTEFPGRYAGETVWIQRDQDKANDNITSLIIGGNDWASAWAVDERGQTPYAVLPGGQRQRTLAYRFGVNLVMYAMTGSYKGDQVHVPEILRRLQQ